jgi:predicted transport protein
MQTFFILVKFYQNSIDMLKKKTVKDHLKNAPQFLIDLFESLNRKILELDKVKDNVTGPYIGYNFLPGHKKPRLFVEVHIQKRNQKIVLHLRPVEYKDPQNKIFEYTYVPKWPLRRGVDIISEQDINYCMPLIEQSYKNVL